MRNITTAAFDMAMDVSNAKDENDEMARIIKHLNIRDVEVEKFVWERLDKRDAELDAKWDKELTKLKTEVAVLKAERDSLQKVVSIACHVVDPEDRGDVEGAIEAMRQEITLHQQERQEVRSALADHASDIMIAHKDELILAYARNVVLRKLLEDCIAITDTMELNESRLDEWIVKVKEMLGEK